MKVGVVSPSPSSKGRHSPECVSKQRMRWRSLKSNSNSRLHKPSKLRSWMSVRSAWRTCQGPKSPKYRTMRSHVHLECLHGWLQKALEKSCPICRHTVKIKRRKPALIHLKVSLNNIESFLCCSNNPFDWSSAIGRKMNTRACHRRKKKNS